MVIFSPVSSIEDIERVINDGRSSKDYLDELWWVMPNQEGHGGHLRCVHKYLAEYPITKEFYENFQAPMTEAKQSEIDTQEVIRPWRDEIKEILCRGGSQYFNEFVISMPHFFDVFTRENLNYKGNRGQLGQILSSMGYSYSSKLVKINGVARRYWTKSMYSNKEIREILYKHSLSKEFDNIDEKEG
jgi:hypothetical protein